ncbi:MAG: hypothetical protein ABUL72_03080 [Armatimonadota bacterium]
MDRNTLEKIKAEKGLDWQESAALEQALEAQAPLKNLVAALEDPSPSMAWRSELNQKLVAEANKRKRKSLVPWIGGLTAVAAASVSLVVIFTAKKAPVPVTAQSSPSFETALTTAYTQAAAKPDVEEDLTSNIDADQDL